MLLTNLQFIFQTHNIKQSALSFPGTKSFVHKLNFSQLKQVVGMQNSKFHETVGTLGSSVRR